MKPKRLKRSIGSFECGRFGWKTGSNQVYPSSILFG